MPFGSIPVIIHIPPSGGPVDKIELQDLGVQAEKIAKWIERKTKEKVSELMKLLRILFVKLHK